MKTIRSVGALSIATGLLLAIGCAQHPSQSAVAAPGTPPPTGVTNAQNASDTRIVDQLASAHCDHEATCDNLGPGKKYMSRQVCIDQSRGSIAQDLNAYSCPGGIDQGALDGCLASLRQQGCSSSFTHLFSQDKCAAGALCMK
jgi:hypothetical protein